LPLGQYLPARYDQRHRNPARRCEWRPRLPPAPPTRCGEAIAPPPMPVARPRRYSTTPAQQFNATSHLRLSTTTTRVDGLNIVSPRKTQWDHRPNRTTAWFSHNRNRPKGKSFIATERHIFSVCRSDRAALFRAMGELFRRIEPWLRNVM
jgi:hypothetical protein